MKKRIGSQNEPIILGFIEKAIDEQLKSHAPEDGIEKGKRGTIATPQQMMGSRRRTEKIFIEMATNISEAEPAKQRNITKQNTRKRKRGPRSVRVLINSENRK